MWRMARQAASTAHPSPATSHPCSKSMRSRSRAGGCIIGGADCETSRPQRDGMAASWRYRLSRSPCSLGPPALVKLMWTVQS